MNNAAKRKAAQKWLAAALEEKMMPMLGKEVDEAKIKAIVVETMSEAVPWMRDLLGSEFKPQNALEFFKLALEVDEIE